MVNSSDDKDGGSRIARAIASHKKRTFWIVLGLVVALAAGFNTLRDAGSSVSSMITEVTDPFREQKEAIDALALEQTVEYVNSKLGQPQQSEALCSEGLFCGKDTSRDLRLNIYRNEHYTVRAVFEANSLKFFAVTLRTDQFKPQIRWLDHELGFLGEVTYKQAYESVPAGVEPDAAMILLGPRSSSYAEVLAAGAPADYQGLVLAWAPDGYGKLPWNVEGAQVLSAAQLSSNDQLPGLDAAESFRTGSVPNTFGLFHDDGFVGDLIHDPQNTISILYKGTDL
jgi:hypothetical protein